MGAHRQHRAAHLGSANANPAALPRAANGLAAAERDRLAQLITRRVTMEQVQTGLDRAPDDVKVIMEMAEP